MLLTTGVERRKVDAGKIILTILGVLIVAAGIVFVGCAYVLSNIH